LAKRPDLNFLIAHPAHFFALGCGSGLAPKAPGTFGTLFAWAMFALFHHHFSDFGLFFLLTVAYIGGIWFIDVTGRGLGDPDHGSIVWDEIVAHPDDDARHFSLATGCLRAVPLFRHHQAAARPLF
jgi:phosphatidylglycerophosphatase A